MAQIVTLQDAVGESISTLIDDYLLSCRARGLTPTTVNHSYGYPLHHVLLPWCEKHEIESVAQFGTRDIDRFTADLIEDGGSRGKLSRNSVHSYLRAVRGFLAWCEREGEQVHAKPQLPRLPRKVLDVLSREEITAMEGAAQTERDKIIIRILGDCGLRAGELCGLREEDLVRRDKQSLLHVHGKGSRERLVPVMPALFRRIERYVRSGRPKDTATTRLFVSVRRGLSGSFEPLTTSGIGQMIHSSAQRAGITKRTYTHLLRHSFLTNGLRGGVNPLILAQIAGHSSLQMLERHYSHLNVQDAYDAIVKLTLDE
jgi:site-specific recombinase XerD